jgi:hypothetical protein
MNHAKEKRLNLCQDSDAYIQRKQHFKRLLVWLALALAIIYFLRA